MLDPEKFRDDFIVWTRSIVMIEETRKTKERTRTERRFFISSLPADAKRITRAVDSLGD